MLNVILDTLQSAAPMAKLACYTTAAVIAGRKITLAGGCKLGGVVAGLLGKTNVADWNKSSHDYWTTAKKDAFKDLTTATSLIFVGLSAGYTEKSAVIDDQPESPNYWSEELNQLYEGRYEMLGAYCVSVLPTAVLTCIFLSKMSNSNIDIEYVIRQRGG